MQPSECRNRNVFILLLGESYIPISMMPQKCLGSQTTKLAVLLDVLLSPSSVSHMGESVCELYVCRNGQTALSFQRGTLPFELLGWIHQLSWRKHSLLLSYSRSSAVLNEEMKRYSKNRKSQKVFGLETLQFDKIRYSSTKQRCNSQIAVIAWPILINVKSWIRSGKVGSKLYTKVDHQEKGSWALPCTR